MSTSSDVSLRPPTRAKLIVASQQSAEGQQQSVGTKRRRESADTEAAYDGLLEEGEARVDSKHGRCESESSDDDHFDTDYEAAYAEKRLGWLVCHKNETYPNSVTFCYYYNLAQGMSAAHECSNDKIYTVACVPTFDPLRDYRLVRNKFAAARDSQNRYRYNLSPESVQLVFYDIMCRSMKEDNGSLR